ncbi:hypothetical protein D3C77_498480 [compost metagenome]
MWFFEIVIAAADRLGAGRHAYAEALDGRLVGDLAAVRQVGRGLAQPGKRGLVVAKHQHMAVFAVPEVVMQAFLLAQALQKMQVALGVLHAILALGIKRWAELETVGIGLDAVFLEEPGDDFGHRRVLEDPRIAA